MNNGYIVLSRSICEQKWYQDPETSVLFLHLLLTANVKNNFQHGIKVKKGSTLTSYQRLSAETGLSVQQAEKAAGKLEKSGQIIREMFGRNIIFTVIGYDNYLDDN